jgi:hypothetical protein
MSNKTTEQLQQEFADSYETHFENVGKAITSLVKAMEVLQTQDHRQAQIWARFLASANLLNDARTLMLATRYDTEEVFNETLSRVGGNVSMYSTVKLVD